MARRQAALHRADRGAAHAPARGRGHAREAIQRYDQQVQDAVLEPVRAFFARQRLDAEFVGEASDPAERIAESARTGKPDLIVLVSHGRGHLASLVMGSVATKVLAATKVPVLLVR